MSLARLPPARMMKSQLSLFDFCLLKVLKRAVRKYPHGLFLSYISVLPLLFHAAPDPGEISRSRAAILAATLDFVDSMGQAGKDGFQVFPGASFAAG